MIRYDYREGLGFYEQFRSSLAARSEISRAYAAGAAIIQNSGLLHFLDKFKRKEPISSRIHNVNPRAEDRLPDAEVQELIYALAGMMRSAGEFYERKDYI